MPERNVKERFQTNKQLQKRKVWLQNVNKTNREYEVTVDHSYSVLDAEGTPAMAEEVVIVSGIDTSWTKGRRVVQVIIYSLKSLDSKYNSIESNCDRMLFIFLQIHK